MEQRKNQTSGFELERTVILFFVAICIAVFPECVYQVVRIFGISVESGTCAKMNEASECFLLLMPVLNAVSYSLMGTKFRREMRKTPLFMRFTKKAGLKYPYNESTIRNTSIHSFASYNR